MIHSAFLKTHLDKLVVIKYYSDVCKACKALAPKYRKLARDERFSTFPIIFAEISLRHNKDYFEEVLKLKALPWMQVYGGGVLLDSFPCPPTMFSALTRKVTHWVQEKINPITLTLKVEPSPQRASEFFVEDDDDIPLQLSDMFMTEDEEEEMPRNNIVLAPRASEFFAGAEDDDDDIPLQLSDLFMMEDEE
jgi:thiol-disulfide isomerase/thioredoxin